MLELCLLANWLSNPKIWVWKAVNALNKKYQIKIMSYKKICNSFTIEIYMSIDWFLNDWFNSSHYSPLLWTEKNQQLKMCWKLLK